MSVFRKFRDWWSKDDLEVANEEARMKPAERDVAEEDYEGRKDDIAVRSGYLQGGQADYERDSEPPR